MVSKSEQNFITHVTKYLGLALISGSIVHIGTLDTGTTRYAVLLLVGLVLMVFGHIREARETEQKINLRYLSLLTGLSLATGLLSGGVQHYLDNPCYAGLLLGVGAFVTYVTLVWKNQHSLALKNVSVVGSIAGAIILFSCLMMEASATNHDHGSQAHHDAQSQPAPAGHENGDNKNPHTH